jgi:hypothetical protein
VGLGVIVPRGSVFAQQTSKFPRFNVGQISNLSLEPTFFCSTNFKISTFRCRTDFWFIRFSRPWTLLFFSGASKRLFEEFGDYPVFRRYRTSDEA